MAVLAGLHGLGKGGRGAREPVLQPVAGADDDHVVRGPAGGWGSLSLCCFMPSPRLSGRWCTWDGPAPSGAWSLSGLPVGCCLRLAAGTGRAVRRGLLGGSGSGGLGGLEQLGRTPGERRLQACRPMGIPATFMLAPGCSPWGPQSEPTTSRDVVTDGGGGADMRRACNRRSVSPGDRGARLTTADRTGCYVPRNQQQPESHARAESALQRITASSPM